ncbi:MAG: GNAT family N-acetyltransferase [Chitinophagaceae bacterium]|nr:GNAT family N-acetyltransferase [Chitinophagaceae bacterium]
MAVLLLFIAGSYLAPVKYSTLKRIDGIQIIDQATGKDEQLTNDLIADFLVQHLDQFGDKEFILNALIMFFNPDRGGFVVVAHEGMHIAGAVIINETGMDGYIPENILVYIAVDKAFRGQGLGKKLMSLTMERARGSIALHVEPDNPARFLYQKLGFTNKYLEMRLQR